MTGNTHNPRDTGVGRRSLTPASWVTLARVALSLAAGALFLRERAELVAVWLCALSIALDAADGWIARRWRHETVLGALLDPVADKIATFVVFATIALRAASPVVWLLFALGSLRDAGLTVQRLRRVGLGRRQIEPDTAGKVKTIVQDVAGLAILFQTVYGGTDLARSSRLVIAAMGVSVFLSYVSWGRYFRSFRRGPGAGVAGGEGAKRAEG